MFIKTKDDQLLTALTTIQRLAKPELVNLRAKGHTLTVKGAGEASSCMQVLSTTSKTPQEVEITVSTIVLMSVIEKRTDVKLSINGSVLVIKSGNYEVEVLSIEGTPITVVPKDVLTGKDGIVLKSKFMNELMRVLPLLELRPLLPTYSEVPIGVKATLEGTFVACFDFIQSACTMLPDLRGDFEFMLPSVTQFIILAKELAGQKYQIAITDTTLYAWNDMLQVALSLPQQEGEQLKLEDIMNLMEGVKDMGFKSLDLKTKILKKFIHNSRGIYDKDSRFELKADGHIANLELKASAGNVKLQTELGKPVRSVGFKCDFTFFAALISKTQEPKVALLVNENLLRLDIGAVSYLMALI